MRVVVMGRLHQRSYETREGEKRTVYEVEVDDVGPSLRNASAKVTKSNRSGGGGGGGGFGGGGRGGGFGGGGGGGQGGSGGYGGSSGRPGRDDPWASDAGFGGEGPPTSRRSEPPVRAPVNQPNRPSPPQAGLCSGAP